MEKERYLNNLIKQFNSANGSSLTDENSKEFIEWRNKRMFQGDTYGYILKQTDIFFDDPSCVEIGKGRYDSVALLHDTSIITPYTDHFMKLNEKRLVIEADFAIAGGVPVLLDHKDENKKEAANCELLKNDEFKIFMTHNPYNENYISDLEHLHNHTDYAIIFGIYGNNYDKDKDEKIKLLNQLKYRLYDYYIESSDTIGDQYFHIIATDIPEKAKRRIKK